MLVDHCRIVIFDKTNFDELCESWRHEISPFYVGEEAAAARSTGLRPIHFSNRGGFNSADISLQVCAIITEL